MLLQLVTGATACFYLGYGSSCSSHDQTSPLTTTRVGGSGLLTFPTSIAQLSKAPKAADVRQSTTEVTNHRVSTFNITKSPGLFGTIVIPLALLVGRFLDSLWGSPQS
ncbi:hypothetical protein Micbo1qcDRAFT_17650 [Microdochium bolleyi]|uniref:Uncharacterized protein n=1 Tax=Microdochium bolleyi TaxID=196109 RepID=A0A136ITX4_9PEZI|nr:hypothetical protein Micbo1qcDRAFT_17650 [Microdochium bolleyi]